MSHYVLGAVVALSTEATVGGVLTDDASMVLTVTKPDGTTQTPALTHGGTGLYSCNYTPATVGHYLYTFVATGAAAGVDAGEFDVVTATRHIVDYIDLKTHLGIDDNDDDATLITAANAANAAVIAYTQRSFEYVVTPTARVFRTTSHDLAHVDDFHTATGLVVETDDSDTGSFASTWAATDYEVEPLNGLDGGAATPYYRLRVVGNRWFPCGRRATLRVTAAWGWTSIPDDVFQAALIKAARLYKRKMSPEGVLGGGGDFGLMRISLRDDPDVCSLLRPYVRTDRRAMVG